MTESALTLQVLSIFLPLRYDLVRFGGSWAQRQVFSVTIIEAAIRANHVTLALGLVAELKVTITSVMNNIIVW